MPAETIALVIAGFLWPFIFQAIGKFGLDGRAAQLVAVVFCYLIAALVQLAGSGTLTVETLIATGSPVATIALVIYRQVIKPDADAAPTPAPGPY